MKKFGSLLGFGIIAMIALSFLVVLMKNLLHYNSNALQDGILYLHALVFMLGIVYAYWHDKHVRIDIFYQKFSQLKKNRVNFFGTLLLLFPFFAFILYSSFNYVIDSWKMLETSSNSGGLPFVYIIKSLILIMPVLMIVLALFKLLRNK